MTYKVPGANFYTDFSGSTVGSAPAGWTERWAPQSSWLVEADASASGGKVLAVNPTGASRFLLSWDAASNDPDAKNFEILMRSKMVGGTTQGMAVGAGRASGATLAESAYRGGGRSAIAVTASKYVAGAYTDLLSAADTQVADTWYLTRFRVNGSSIGVKVWPSGTTEPTAWVQATDVGITAKGWIGLNVGTPGKNVIDYVAVATAGRKASKP